jgi:hypothetical protein
VQGGIARFFYPNWYRTTRAVINHVSKRLSDIVGSQRPTAAATNQGSEPTRFSPRTKAAKVQSDLKDQLMALAEGDVQNYNELRQGDIELFLIKFEQFIKSHNGRGSHNV